jgi:hypothetical protein
VTASGIQGGFIAEIPQAMDEFLINSARTIALFIDAAAIVIVG